ncbi:RICIN domain-containing protein [Streptomyces sp. TRM66268-LWL]|uniref:RICIN domain-containing protein n=1 Tax=Streptomyces polyasparticus TaxID=2767826 RepID=A0ABR7SVL8_9ACTN|nr:M60 family metallopeptidase [Streptomyces polyasparticus]MBC9719557.1 RICIN domain-containing protein [Streptomyces polyasparticus]
MQMLERRGRVAALTCTVTGLLVAAAPPAPAPVAVPSATVRLVAEATNRPSHAPGEEFTQSIDFYNDGPATADTVVVEATMPTGLILKETYAGHCTIPEPNRLRCEQPGPVSANRNKEYNWALLTFQVDPAFTGSSITNTLTGTSYIGGSVSSRTALRTTFQVRRPPAYPDQPSPQLFPQKRSFSVQPLPSPAAESTRLGSRMYWPGYRPTGFHLNPRRKLVVTVTTHAPDALPPSLVVGNHDMIDPAAPRADLPDPRTYPLTPGRNEITDPVGGILSVEAPRRRASDPKIDITFDRAAQPIPLYVLGRTSNRQWQHMLRVANRPFAQLQGRRIQLAVTRDTARQYATASQDDLLRTYDRIVDAQDAVSGITRNGSVRPSPLLQQVVEYRTGFTANATDYRIAWPTDWSRPELMTAKGLSRSWGMWHELGHQRQMTKWTWDGMGEQTVNIYALAARRLFPKIATEHATAREWSDEARRYLALPFARRNFDAQGALHFGRFTMFEQLRLLYGNAFYPRLHQAARPVDRGQAGSSAAQKRFFMVQASRAAGSDLTAYFTEWGLRPDRGTRDAVAALRLPAQAPIVTRTGVYGVGQPLANAHSGQCLADPRGSRQAGTRMVQWSCSGGADRRWRLAPAAGGTHTLSNAHSGQCLAVPKGSKAKGTRLVQWPCLGNASQRWRVTSAAGNTVTLTNKATGQCLTVPGGSRVRGTELVQWPCLRNTAQRWRLR